MPRSLILRMRIVFIFFSILRLVLIMHSPALPTILVFLLSRFVVVAFSDMNFINLLI
jgi:hypothetical protein